MPPMTISKPSEPGFWIRTWQALRAFDEVVHHDPAEAQHRRIERLETRLEDLETNAHNGVQRSEPRQVSPAHRPQAYSAQAWLR